MSSLAPLRRGFSFFTPANTSASGLILASACGEAVDAAQFGDRRQASRWHLDRKVPLALILTFSLTIAVQACTSVWWASGLTSRVE